MTLITKWAQKWNIPDAALTDLKRELNATSNSNDTCADRSEDFVQSSVRLEAAQKGVYLWRNNVGAYKTDTGRVLRYGLANDSKKVNKIIKSSDLIGIRPITITPDMVGSTLGQFVARECKKSKWRFSSTEEQEAQLRFLTLVTSLGGDAAFANTAGTL